ncbi:MAG: alanyl-tRNA editing protein [Clostridia bacterium]|nr:alanyl-tRNA editing protein [Clostridia bacterium]
MQKTHKLYEKDAYQTDFEGVVLAVTEEKNGYAVVLNQTLFFPEEAGQKSDLGYLGEAKVLSVTLADGIITHHTDKPLPLGATVSGKIDFAERYRNMQNHTGEHIVSGLFKRLYNYDNFGFHLGREDVTIDIMGELTREDILRVERLANQAVYDNLPVLLHYPTPEEAAGLSYRSKIEIKEDLRLVEIPDIDLCACCAPHVKRTGEIGVIKLLDFIRYKGGVRIHMHCGTDALRDYHARYEAVAHIAQALSLKQSELAEGFDRFYRSYEERGAEIAALKAALAKEKAAHIAKGDEILCLFEKENDPVFLREYALCAMESHGGTVCLCAKKEEGVYAYILVSEDMDFKADLPRINGALSGRGGGRGTSAQGQFAATEEEISAFFASFTPTKK